MSAGDGWLITGAVGLIVVAGLMAMAEAALTAFSKARADELVASGRRGATRLRRLVDDPAPPLNTALLLRIAAEITAVVLVAGLLSSVFRMRWQAVLIVIGNALTPGKGFREGPFATEAELRELVDLAEAGGVVESGEREMIHSVFELGDTIVREVMVPRTDVVFIEAGKTLRQFQSLALRSGFSRIPVVGASGLDDVLGIAYLKDIARRLYDHREAETVEHVDSVMRPVTFVPDSKPIDDLLREMQAQRIHLAIVVDEYGGTAGIATIEDILEEIVGEITDEYDIEEAPFEELGDGSVRVSSRLHVDELGELFGMSLSDEDVDSVGGLMAKQLGRVPIPGSEVEFGGLHLVAERPSGRRNRIGTIVVTRAEPKAAAPVGNHRQESS